jgi:hypothetical protein
MMKQSDDRKLKAIAILLLIILALLAGFIYQLSRPAAPATYIARQTNVIEGAGGAGEATPTDAEQELARRDRRNEALEHMGLGAILMLVILITFSLWIIDPP